jgi:hypothetical protein
MTPTPNFPNSAEPKSRSLRYRELDQLLLQLRRCCIGIRIRIRNGV